jgi:hypothetical protein
VGHLRSSSVMHEAFHDARRASDRRRGQGHFGS